MAVSNNTKIYVCGGFSDGGDHIDLWQFDMGRREWEMLSPDNNSANNPAPRYCAALALYGRKLYLFGGRSRKFPKLNFNDLWIFDLDAAVWDIVHEQRQLNQYDATAEFPGYHAKSSSAVVGAHWYIWGGEGVHGHVSDFWRLDFEKVRWELVQTARDDDPVFW